MKTSNGHSGTPLLFQVGLLQAFSGIISIHVSSINYNYDSIKRSVRIT